MINEEYNELREKYLCKKESDRVERLDQELKILKLYIREVRFGCLDKKEESLSKFWNGIIKEIIGDKSKYKTLLFNGNEIHNENDKFSIYTDNNCIHIIYDNVCGRLYPTIHGFLDYSVEEFKSYFTQMVEPGVKLGDKTQGKQVERGDSSEVDLIGNSKDKKE